MKDIPGFEGLYAATSCGKIWSHRKQKFMVSCGDEGDYRLVMLSKDGVSKCYFVHRLVALTYLPNPDNLPQINHKDEVKDHNWLNNLEWCTAHYNLAYSNICKAPTPVYCIELDKTFDSIKSAAKELGIAQPNLSTHINHNSPKSLKGMHFRKAI